MKILHISDIHYKSFYKACGNGYDRMLSKMENPLIQLKECLNQIKEKQKIDLLLISGDLTEGGSIDDYDYLRKWFRREIGTIPISVTLGNHDIKENFYQGWLKEDASTEPYNEILNLGDCYLVSFDTSSYGITNGWLSNSQFIWLDKCLSAHQDKPVVLMTHHHLLENQSNMSTLPQSEKLIRLMKKYSVHSLLNGHTHRNFSGYINQIQYFTVDGMSFVGEDFGKDIVKFEQKYGYNLYDLKEGKIHQYITKNFFNGKVIDWVHMMDK